MFIWEFRVCEFYGNSMSMSVDIRSMSLSIKKSWPSIQPYKSICLFEFWLALTDVKLLDCSNNQLTDIPASLSEMLALEQLYLRHNKLRLFPKLSAPGLKVTIATRVSPGVKLRFSELFLCSYMLLIKHVEHLLSFELYY